MSTASEIIAGLGGNPATGRCRCPAHDDKNPSLDVVERNGKVLFKCRADCSQDNVIAALRQRGLWRTKADAPAGRSITMPRPETSDTEDIARALLRAAAKSEDRPKEYLRGRGLKIAPAGLKLIDRATMRRITGRGYPAMVAQVTNASGRAVVQVTFLTLDAKHNACGASGRNVRLTYGTVGGGFVILGEAQPDKPLIVGEGIESALAAMELAGLPGIAVLGTSNLPKVVPPPCSEVILAADNDPPGIEAAKKLAAHLAAAGRVVRIAAPVTQGNDWNDEMKNGNRDELKRQITEAEPYEADAAATMEARIGELAKLDPVEYEAQRKRAAADLDIRASKLDQFVEAARTADSEAETAEFLAPVVPWDKPVDGADMLGALADMFDKYIVLPKHAAEALALWVVHSHAHDAARHSPIMFIASPTKRCGKTNLLCALQMVVPKPLSAANVTPATVFRAIHRWKPTMLIDETDTFLSDKADLRGVLNSGHTKSQAYVLRCVGDDMIPQQFSTWCPKAFAAIGRLPSTLEDRAIKIELRRKLKTDAVERLPVRDDAYDELRRKAARWAADNMSKLERARLAPPSELSDRARDNWYPLLAIADLAGGDWPEWAQEAARQLTVVDDDESFAELLLKDLRAIFDREQADALWSESIVTSLLEIEGRPWPDFKHGKPINANSMARLLKPFKVFPRKLRLDGSRKRSGYERRRFEPVWRRYLDAPDRAQPGPPGQSKENQGVTTDLNRAAPDHSGPVVIPRKSLINKGLARRSG
jgi:putative DNA primase/helicase